MTWSHALDGNSVKAGEYTWQLPRGLNVERVQVELSQPNSLAPVILSGRRDSSLPWQPLSSGLLYRLTQNGEDVVQNELQLPGQAVQQLKLTVDERGGGLGAQAPTVKFAVRATQLVFLARGPGPYTLALGNATVKAASLPLATLIPDYSPAKLATLGQASVDGGAGVTPAASTRRRRWAPTGRSLACGRCCCLGFCFWRRWHSACCASRPPTPESGWRYAPFASRLAPTGYAFHVGASLLAKAVDQSIKMLI